MHLRRLTLHNVRTFRSLDLHLERGAYVIAGPNASGKTNLLQAITTLATTRTAAGSGVDGDQITWSALREEALPAARMGAEVVTASEPVSVEIVIASKELGGEAAAQGPPPATRRFRVNGVARRASDLVGRLRVVPFSADDMRVIEGPPAVRRRYLDITLSQLSQPYVRALQRYRRVLEQRNSLLRRVQERRARPAELEFWDDELARAGAEIIAARREAIATLSADAAEQYAALAPGGESLAIEYRAALPEPAAEAAEAAVDALEARFRHALLEGRDRDVYAGTTRIGPHRDDLGFRIDGREASTFASRGQQRTVALALRLAEVRLSTARTGDPPVLLLDDVLSELDAERRARVLATAYAVDQVLITTPDPDRPSREELPQARRLRIEQGRLVEQDA